MCSLIFHFDEFSVVEGTCQSDGTIGRYTCGCENKCRDGACIKQLVTPIPSLLGKKIIEWEFDSPGIANDVVNISSAMQKSPFYGTVLQWNHFGVFSKSAYR